VDPSAKHQNLHEGKLTHPILVTKAPATTAPKETPVVKPELTRQINKPLLFFPDNSSTKIKEMVMMPAPAVPLITLPTRKTVKSGACDVTMPPREKSKDATNIQLLGEKV
jgi:hypothetical protein